ncbi:MAG: Ldh family oxidoreductase [Hyphomicrobiaceae bacterium]
MVEVVSLSLNEVRSLAHNSLIQNGCNAANADAVAETIVIAERDGSESHGLFRLPGYIASLRSGKVNGTASPTITQLRPGVIRVDNDNGYAPLGILTGHTPLVDAARRQGIAFMALVNSYHFAALWHEIESLCEAGVCAFACTAHTPTVAPFGGSRAVFSTNPIAFGWPRTNRPPLVFDMATAAKARGDIMLAAREGHTVPEGSGLDAEGNPTTDPRAILDGGVQLPFGGYKGSAIALMVELLAAAIVGESFSFEAGAADNKDGGPARGGEFILAIDPSAAGGENWARHAEGLFLALAKQEGVRLPGDRRYANRKRTPKDGVRIPAKLHSKILELQRAT